MTPVVMGRRSCLTPSSLIIDHGTGGRPTMPPLMLLLLTSIKNIKPWNPGVNLVETLIVWRGWVTGGEFYQMCPIHMCHIHCQDKEKELRVTQGRNVNGNLGWKRWTKERIIIFLRLTCSRETDSEIVEDFNENKKSDNQKLASSCYVHTPMK